MAPSANRLALFAAAAAVLLFVALGITAIPLIGPQQDETLFVRGILSPVYVESTSLRNVNIPFMLMPYIGALKIWLCKPVFAVAGASLWTLRLPALFACAISIWLTFLIARRFIAAPFAALAACLLAVDPIYLFTGTFDWGPVALQHLLALLMVWCALRTHETASWKWAAAAGLACGLGVWDKISFLWILAGLLTAVFVIGRGPALRVWRNPRLLAAAFIGATLGSIVFLRYNLRYDLATFRASAGLDLPRWPNKLQGLWLSLDGSALFGFMVNDSGASVWAGWCVLPFVLVAAFIAIPLIGPLRTIAGFLSVSMAVTFLAMAVMKNAGESSHHIVLLWPLPQLIIAAAAAGLWTRGRLAQALTVFCVAAVVGSSLGVTARHFHLARNEGPGPQWTLASRDLAAALARLNPPDIFVVDWGILDPLRLFGAGHLPLLPASDTVVMDLPDRLRDGRLQRVRDSRTLVVSRPDPLLNFSGMNERLDNWAAEQGLVRTPVESVKDAQGKEQFLIFRYTPPPQSEPPAPPR